MPEQALTICNRLGLHARASAKLVNLASQFVSDISIRKDNLSVNGKSIMGVLTLAAANGSVIHVRAEGSDAPSALHQIAQLVHDRFGEDQ